MIAERLNDLMTKNGTTKVGLSQKIGLSDQTIGNVLRGADVKVSSLKKIADYFNVPIGYFFDDNTINQTSTGNSNVLVGHDNNGQISVSEYQNKLTDAYKEIEHLKELNSEKERMIQILLKNSKD